MKLASHTALVFVLLLLGGCKKQSLDKVKDVYGCWDVGWQIVEGCHISHRSDCDDDWFRPARTTAMSDPKADAAFGSRAQRCAAATGISVWNQLEADDVTNELADAIVELQAAVKARDFDAIRKGRGKVRELLGIR